MGKASPILPQEGCKGRVKDCWEKSSTGRGGRKGPSPFFYQEGGERMGVFLKCREERGQEVPKKGER